MKHLINEIFLALQSEGLSWTKLNNLLPDESKLMKRTTGSNLKVKLTRYINKVNFVLNKAGLELSIREIDKPT